MTTHPHTDNDRTTAARPTVGATVHGYPRIGRDRELKHALERYWAGDTSADELLETARLVRTDAIGTMRDAGLDTVPVGHFALYDHLLDAAVTVGAIPQRFRGGPADGPDLGGCPLATYFAMARGTDREPPLEMTKWFDTNYHVLVPEIGPGTAFQAHPGRLAAEHAEAIGLGVRPRPVLVGPYTLLAAAKPEAGAPAGFDPLDRLDDLVETYVELFRALRAAGRRVAAARRARRCGDPGRRGHGGAGRRLPAPGCRRRAATAARHELLRASGRGAARVRRGRRRGGRR